MKTLKFIISILIFALFFTSCSKDDDSPAPNSEPEPINTAPDSFDLVGVTNGAIEVNITPSFSWNTAIDPDDDTVTYTLLLDTNENPTTVYTDNLNTTSFSISERLNVITQYYWKVEANDGNGNTTQSNTYSFTTRNLNLYDNPVVEYADFPARYSHATVVFDDKLWITGGTNPGSRNQKDVWYSADGVNWIEAIPDAPFSVRVSHTLTVFDNKLWVIGGTSDDGSKNDVWYSENGINWTEVTSSAAFSERYGHTTAVFDNKIWVIGGNDIEGRKNDVWFSADGVNWTEATPNAAFSERDRHTTVVFDNKLWVVGGHAGEYKNDVWFSADGVNWAEATANAPFSGRFSHTTTVFDNKMWVIGGDDIGGRKNDIWFSNDGMNWTEATSNAILTYRRDHTATVFDDKIWVIGGFYGLGSGRNDVWVFD